MAWASVVLRLVSGLLVTTTANPYAPYTQVDRPLCLPSPQGTADRSATTLRVASRNWISAQLATEVFAIVLREYLNYNVVLLDVSSSESTKNWGVDMDADLFDFEMESWQAGDSTSQFLKYVVEKQVVVAGKIGYAGRSAIFTTPAALEKHPFAAYYVFFQSSERLKASDYVMFGQSGIKEFLGDDFPVCQHSDIPYCGAPGTTFENAYAPPQCQEKPEDCGIVFQSWSRFDKAFFEQLTTNHNLKLIHTFLGGKNDLISNLINEGKDVLFHWWEPDPFPSKVKAKRISYPDFTFGCDAGDTQEPSGPIACDYPDLLLAKLVKASVRKQAPESFFFWSNVEIYSSQLDSMMAETKEAGGTLTTFESACKWVKEHKTAVEAWAPPCISNPKDKDDLKDGDDVFDAREMKCKKVSRFPEVPLTDTCFAVRPGTAVRTDKEIRVGVRSWHTQSLASYVVGIVLKEFLGYFVWDTDSSGSATSAWGPDLEAGSFDIDIENWQSRPSGVEYRDFVIDRGVVLNPGLIGYTGRSGLWVPPEVEKDIPFAGFYLYYAEKSEVDKSNLVKYPGTPVLRDLRTHLDSSFPSCTASWCPNSSTAFEGYWVPPQCESEPDKCLLLVHAQSNYDSSYFEQLVRNSGMLVIFAYYGGKFGDIIKESVKKANLMFYMWEPDILPASIGALRISFPDYSYGCDAGNNRNANTGPVACDYGASGLNKLVRRQVRANMPEAYMFLSNFMLLKDDIDGMLSNYSNVVEVEYPNETYHQKCFKAACMWAKANEAKIATAFAPPCISSPKATTELRLGDRTFDAATISCTEVTCKADEILNTKGSVSCERCAPGKVPDSTRTVCDNCPPGQVPMEGVCADCPMGSVCPFGTEVPQLCSIGTYNDKADQLECTRCEKGKYQPHTGMSACIECPSPMTTSGDGSRRAAACICPEKMYKPLNVTNATGHLWINTTVPCLQCPAGMVCEEGSDQVNIPCRGDTLIPKSNRTKAQLSRLYPVPPLKFYSNCDESSALSCFKCLSEHVCPGEDVGECAHGTEGIACGRCAKGFYKFEEECHKCNDVEASSVIFPVLPICAAPLAAVVYYLVSRDGLDKWNSPANHLASALFVVLVYIQTLSAISSCYLEQPEPMSESSGWTTYTVRLLSLLRPSCTTFSSFQVNFIGQLCLPVYGLVVFVFVFFISVIASIANKRLRMNGDCFLNCYFALFNTFFIGIAQQTFQLFQCYEHPNSERSLRSQADILCGSDTWNDVVAVAFVAVVVFCGGFLALNVYIIVTAPARFQSVTFQTRWKFVFIKYRPSVWWWGLVILIKGVWLNLPTVVFDTGAAQLIWLQSMLSVYFVVGYAISPWRSIVVGALDIIQHAFLIFLFGFAPHFIARDDPTSDMDIGLAYALFSMAPLGFGFCTFIILLIKRIKPEMTYADWRSSAHELCTSFSQITDPELLAKIMSLMPWHEIILLNSTRSLLHTTYLFEKHPPSVMQKSILLKTMSTSTRLQAEASISDYLGLDYQQKVALKTADANGKGNGGSNPVMASDVQAPPSAPLPVVKVSTGINPNDLLDALDFPIEDLSAMHQMCNMASLVTPRDFTATSRSGVATPNMTPSVSPRCLSPRGMPLTPKTPRTDLKSNGVGHTPRGS